jgi:serine phosphatase RsbU (regulator of sigma subunit)/PAS domain-containing protein
MMYQFNPYAIAVLITALIAGAIAIYTWRRRPAASAGQVTLLVMAVAVWSFGYAMELASPDKPTMLFWIRLEYLGIAPIAALWLIFVFQYTGHEKWLTRRNAALLFIIPCVTLILNWTNNWHSLFYSKVEIDRSGPIAVLALTKGGWYWVHTANFYLSLLLGTVLLVRMYVQRPRLYRGQVGIILVATLVPSIGNVIYLSGLSPFPNLDLNPFAFTVTCLAIVWGLFGFRLLDIVPVARDALFESMSDGVIVLDAHNRIVDVNQAARALIGPDMAVGQSVEAGLAAWPGLVAQFSHASKVQTEVTLGGKTPLYLDLRISPLHGRGNQLRGRLAILRDVTSRRQAEQAVQAAQQREMNLAHDIQASLLPRETPHIPGIDIAGLSIPAREVGGDLYDYYELPANLQNPHGGYAVAVGDVSGKGTPAALYMAVSTTMLNAKAIFAPDVGQLLNEINTVLYRYMSPNRMNTALCYVRLIPEEGGAATRRYTAHIANAGLVWPILRRAAECNYLEVSGLPLGIAPDISYTAQVLPLYQDDILVLSTDGIVEATNASEEMYGFDRLAARVASAPHGSAQDIQQWILSDVHEFVGDHEQFDDLTLIVMVVE